MHNATIIALNAYLWTKNKYSVVYIAETRANHNFLLGLGGGWWRGVVVWIFWGSFVCPSEMVLYFIASDHGNDKTVGMRWNVCLVFMWAAKLIKVVICTIFGLLSYAFLSIFWSIETPRDKVMLVSSFPELIQINCFRDWDILVVEQCNQSPPQSSDRGIALKYKNITLPSFFR